MKKRKPEITFSVDSDEEKKELEEYARQNGFYSAGAMVKVKFFEYLKRARFSFKTASKNDFTPETTNPTGEATNPIESSISALHDGLKGGQ